MTAGDEPVRDTPEHTNDANDYSEHPHVSGNILARLHNISEISCPAELLDKYEDKDKIAAHCCVL